MVDTKTLAELSTLAASLNSQSDNLNEHIDRLNAVLAEMNIGLEHWMTQPIVSSGRRQNSYYSPPMEYEEDTYLGYCKREERWQLCIREDMIEYRWNNDEREAEDITESTYTPLLKASRDIRLTAVDQFDELLRSLKRDVEQKLAQISRAKKLAKAE